MNIAPITEPQAASDNIRQTVRPHQVLFFLWGVPAVWHCGVLDLRYFEGTIFRLMAERSSTDEVATVVDERIVYAGYISVLRRRVTFTTLCPTATNVWTLTSSAILRQTSSARLCFRSILIPMK